MKIIRLSNETNEIKENYQNTLFTNSNEELLAKFPHKLPTDYLLNAIQNAKKMLEEIKDSATRIKQNTKPLENMLESSILEWQDIVDSRNRKST